MTGSHLMPTYNRSPLHFVRGEGAWLYDSDDKAYLDFSCGVAVTSLGHNHPRLVAALQSQAERLWHVSNLHQSAAQEKLAQSLCAKTFADMVFFCNSGTEAIEGLIKAVRKYFAAKGEGERTEIISFKHAFHGRSLAALAAAGNEDYLSGFGEPLAGFVQIEGFDIAKTKAAIHDKTAAILIEPVQGEGGVQVVEPRFLKALRDLCDQHGILLALDEVQCGMGRGGKLFAHEWADIKPDIMAIAKALGGGFPLGAVLATKAVAQAMSAGTHGSTYGGNLLAMAVGQEVFDIIAEADFLAHVQDMGQLLRQKLGYLQDQYQDIIGDITGQGLMLGIKAQIVNTDLVAALWAQNLLTVGAGLNVVRLLPPLTITADEIEQAIAKIEAACINLRAEMAAE